ncbi:GTPase [Aureitalea sp. L0-47]|uniref:GTPase n=1 Tax=Aureitalea sp. L0-47 TaxID=2816962 RepID=UPI002238002D|nr:GTPase [Aureitalea sp. L0-47]MCW5520061.1 GTPase [Aureitalea sp. L0-47]
MTVLFVYNANSGAASAVFDSMHKMLSPSTYDCKLCELTFGTFSEKRIWKKFRQHSNYEFRFLHKDEFLKRYKSKWLPKYDFPVALLMDKDSMELFISSEEFQELKTTRQLIRLVEERLSQD